MLFVKLISDVENMQGGTQAPCSKHLAMWWRRGVGLLCASSLKHNSVWNFQWTTAAQRKICKKKWHRFFYFCVHSHSSSQTHRRSGWQKWFPGGWISLICYSVWGFGGSGYYYCRCGGGLSVGMTGSSPSFFCIPSSIPADEHSPFLLCPYIPLSSSLFLSVRSNKKRIQI